MTLFQIIVQVAEYVLAFMAVLLAVAAFIHLPHRRQDHRFEVREVLPPR